MRLSAVYVSVFDEVAVVLEVVTGVTLCPARLYTRLASTSEKVSIELSNRPIRTVSIFPALYPFAPGCGVTLH